MAKVTGIELPQGSGAGRKALRAMGHGVVAMMKHDKRSGDHVLIHYDDGTTSQHTLGVSSDKGDSFHLELPLGVEA